VVVEGNESEGIPLAAMMRWGYGVVFFTFVFVLLCADCYDCYEL